MAAFPTSISCIVNSGFKDILPVTTKYLGSQTFTDKANAKVTALIETHADMEAFTRWYITDTLWGTIPFTILLPLFGVSRNWSVKFTKEPDIRPSESASYIRYVDMELEIQDDIDTYISI